MRWVTEAVPWHPPDIECLLYNEIKIQGKAKIFFTDGTATTKGKTYFFNIWYAWKVILVRTYTRHKTRKPHLELRLRLWRKRKAGVSELLTYVKCNLKWIPLITCEPHYSLTIIICPRQAIPTPPLPLHVHYLALRQQPGSSKTLISALRKCQYML
jgi:hypothetical protein